MVAIEILLYRIYSVPSSYPICFTYLSAITVIEF